jgi:hypothetical protein
MKQLKHTEVWIFVLVVLAFFSLRAQAQSTDFNTYMLMQSYMSASDLQPSGEARMYDTSFYINGLQVDDSCHTFVSLDESNILGPTGQYAYDQLLSGQFERLINTSALNRYCPNYPNLSQQDRALMWVLILTSMAHFESNCNATAGNTGAPNGTAYGYFQLHKGHEQYYDGSEGTCVQNASTNGRQSVRCALGMISFQLQRDGALFSGGSYWDVLRPNGAIYRGKHKYQWIRDGLINSLACKLNTI